MSSSGGSSDRNSRGGNTGVSHTCDAGGGLALGDVVLDWLAFTLPTESESDVERALTGVSETFGDLVPASRGYHGYESSAFVLDRGRVAWSRRRPDSGVHVALGSGALAVLARVDGAMSDVRGFLQYLLDCGARFTRVDLALDDRRGVLDLDVIEHKVRDGAVTMSWRSGTATRDLMGGGVTVALGSRRSESYMRIYDKRAETLAGGGADVGHEWVRVELELHHERATAAVRAIVSRGGAVVPAIVRSQVEFRERGGADTNKSRWPVSPWWRRFLGHCERVALRVARGAESSLDRSERWVERQVSGTLSTLFELHGGDLGWLMGMLDRGRAKRPAWQQALLAALGGDLA